MSDSTILDTLLGASGAAAAQRHALVQLAYLDEGRTGQLPADRVDELLQDAMLKMLAVAAELNAGAQDLVAHRVRLLREHPESFEGRT